MKYFQTLSRCIWILLVLAGATSTVRPVFASSFQLTVPPQTPEVVFNWQKSRCDTDTIPDSPARALRLADGRVLLIASHYTNRVMIGRSLSSVAIDCNVTSRGEELADPSQFDDRFWVQSFLHTADGRILGLASHEYHGKRHPGSCAVAATARVRCWYSSIVATEFNPKSLTFQLLPLSERVVAAPVLPYDRNGPARSGFFTVTNLAKVGGSEFTLIYQEGMGKGGNCLFRQAQASDPYVWEGLSADGKWYRFADPYLAAKKSAEVTSCTPVGSGVLTHPVSSLFFLEHQAVWLAVYATRENNISGIYYATSADLKEWSKPSLLFRSDEARDQPGKCASYYSYPSLLDEGSDSNDFDRGGDHLWLYLTRDNFTDCHSYMNRDLVRYSVKLSAP